MTSTYALNLLQRPRHAVTRRQINSPEAKRVAGRRLSRADRNRYIRGEFPRCIDGRDTGRGGPVGWRVTSLVYAPVHWIRVPEIAVVVEAS